jgi:hypothetical protein
LHGDDGGFRATSALLQLRAGSCEKPTPDLKKTGRGPWPRTRRDLPAISLITALLLACVVLHAFAKRPACARVSEKSGKKKLARVPLHIRMHALLLSCQRRHACPLLERLLLLGSIAFSSSGVLCLGPDPLIRHVFRPAQLLPTFCWSALVVFPEILRMPTSDTVLIGLLRTQCASVESTSLTKKNVVWRIYLRTRVI